MIIPEGNGKWVGGVQVEKNMLGRKKWGRKKFQIIVLSKESSPTTLLSLSVTTTLRFDILRSFTVCAQTSAFWYKKSWNFQDSQLRMRINTKPNAKKKRKKRRQRKMPFFISHQSTSQSTDYARFFWNTILPCCNKFISNCDKFLLFFSTFQPFCLADCMQCKRRSALTSFLQ